MNQQFWNQHLHALCNNDSSGGQSSHGLFGADTPIVYNLDNICYGKDKMYPQAVVPKVKFCSNPR